MSFLSPKLPPPPAPPPNPPTLANAQVQLAGQGGRPGLPPTMMTGPQGLTAPASTTRKTLLGQ